MTLRLGQPGEKLIKDSEVLMLKPYHGAADAPEIFTIGWGAIRYLDGTRVRLTSPPITKEQAQALFARDTFTPLQCLEACISKELGQNQVDALVSLIFNIGTTNFEHSMLLRNINRGEEDRIEDRWLAWDHAAGREVGGLLKRRKAEYALFIS